MRLDADRFLEDLTGRYAKSYAKAIDELLVAVATGDKVGRVAARKRLEPIITETMGVAEVLGASLVLQQAAGVVSDDRQRQNMASDLPLANEWWSWRDREPLDRFAHFKTQDILPRVTLAEAVEDMIDRTPVTIRRAAERTAQRISELYSEGRVTAFAYSAEQAVTVRVQGLIREALAEGIAESKAGRLIVRSVDAVRMKTQAWSEGYARMAFRTNVNTAVTAGRFRQVQDPDIREVLPCFRYDSVGDADTRDNHDAGDGMILKVNNPAWNRVAPPNGYNCRCQVSLVTLPMLRRMGRVSPSGAIREDRVPSGLFPDPGFRHGGRPDLMMVEVAG
jgi:SPP1 gp7 family putative phage head morphogenesis protein